MRFRSRERRRAEHIAFHFRILNQDAEIAPTADKDSILRVALRKRTLRVEIGETTHSNGAPNMHAKLRRRKEPIKRHSPCIDMATVVIVGV